VTRAEVNEREFILSVTDHGEGMTEEAAQDGQATFVSTKPPGAGTGLGLAISDSIVQTHGGTLVIESSVGHGTTVAVHLPLRSPQ